MGIQTRADVDVCATGARVGGRGVRGAEHMDLQRLDGGGEGYGMP